MKQSDELIEIINGWFEAVAKGDTSWVDKYVSKQAGVRLVGTDPNEWLTGEDVIEFLKNEAQTLGGNVKVSHGETEAFTDGTVGWGVARPVVILPNGKEFRPRWSAVFHQEEGSWKLVQLHASVGVPNEEIL
jgi:hypothetical protein